MCNFVKIYNFLVYFIANEIPPVESPFDDHDAEQISMSGTY